MATDWPRVKVSELCDLIVDCVNKTAPTSKNKTSYKMIRTPNIKRGRINLQGCRNVDRDIFEKWTRRAKVEQNDVLLTREAPMGEAGIVNFKDSTFLGQRIVQYRTNPQKLDPHFLLYSFLSSDLQFQFRRHNGSGSIVSHIRVPDCHKFEISTPPLEDQKRISQVLRNIDEKIELNTRINSELEAMAKTLYNYWFVQFDFPDANGKPYKSSGGKMVYNKTLKRDIPEDWEHCELGNYISFKRGLSYKSTELNKEGHPFINLKSFALDGTFKHIGTKFYTGKYKHENLVTPGNLVIAITDVTRNADIIGKAFSVPDIFDAPPLISCDVTAVYSEHFNACYLEHLFNSDYYHRYIKHFASGTLVLHLNLNGIRWFKTILPPASILEKFEAFSNSLLEQRTITLRENRTLSTLRDWLLPMLMNGQARVSE